MADLVFTYSAPAAESMTAMAMAVSPLVDETSPDSISGLTASRGKAYAVGGGGIVLDLRDEGISDSTNVTLNYTRHSGASSEAVEATVTVNLPHYAKAWHAAEFYMPEVDPSTDDLVFEIPPGSRVVCCSVNGFSEADIIAAEPSLSSAPGDWGLWLRDNPANGGGGLYYGQGDTYALDFDMANALMGRLTNSKFASAWMLFKRGDDFSAYNQYNVSLQEKYGKSPLYPIFIGVYGTGALPIWSDAACRILKGGNLVSSGGEISGGCGILDWAKNCGRDNYSADLIGTSKDGDSMFSATGNSTTLRHAFMRRIKSRGVFKKTPPAGGTWTNPASQGRMSAFHPGKAGDVLHEKIFIAQSGASMNYRADRSTAYDKPPDMQSHSIYHPSGVWGFIYSWILSSNASGSFMQFRSGGFLTDSFSWGHNSGYNISVGFYDHTDALGKTGNEKYGGGFSLIDRTWLGAAGYKGWYTDWSGNLAGGVDLQTVDTSLINSGAINSGVGNIYSSSTDIGPGVANSSQATGGYAIEIDVEKPGNDDPASEFYIHPKSNFTISGYVPAAVSDGIFRDNDTTDPLPAGAASEGTRDATTVLAYAASVMGGTPTILDWEDYLWGLDAPWVHAPLMSAQACEVVGHDPHGTPVSGETLTFKPSTTFFTPGFMSRIPYDWDKGYLPGEAPNNDVVIPSNLSWNHYAAYQPRDITLGPGVSLRMPSHCLRPSGTVTCNAGGNSLELVRGAKFDIADKAGGVLDVSVSESRFTVAGDIGGIDLEVFYEGQAVIKEGGSLTIDSGRTLTLHGFGALAFDGSAGGTAELVLNGTLTIKPTSRIQVDGLTLSDLPVDYPGSSDPGLNDFNWPKIGTTLTGANGAVVTAREWYQIDTVSTYLIIDSPTGALVDNEALTAADTELGPYDMGEQAFGAVKGTPTWAWPSIGELNTGINGYDSNFVPVATSVVSTVTLGGTSVLHLDVTNMAVSGTPYTILIADAMSGVFTEVTAEGNSDKDLTVVIDTASTPKTIKVTISSGSGNISGGT